MRKETSSERQSLGTGNRHAACHGMAAAADGVREIYAAGWPGVRQPRVGPAAPHGKGRADVLPGAYIRAYISRDAALFVASSRQQACAKKHTHMRARHSYQRQCRLRTAAMALARRMALAWAIWQMYEGQGARGLRVQVRAATWRALTDPANRRAAREEAFRDASTHAHGDGATFAPGCRPAYTPRCTSWAQFASQLGACNFEILLPGCATCANCRRVTVSFSQSYMTV